MYIRLLRCLILVFYFFCPTPRPLFTSSAAQQIPKSRGKPVYKPRTVAQFATNHLATSHSHILPDISSCFLSRLSNEHFKRICAINLCLEIFGYVESKLLEGTGGCIYISGAYLDMLRASCQRVREAAPSQVHIWIF